jgi:hypothetical protein
MQVWADVERRGPKKWIALDDDGNGWPAWCLENSIQTDAVLGISEQSVLERIKVALRSNSANGLFEQGFLNQVE